MSLRQENSKILIVDDEPGIRALLVSAIREFLPHCQIEVASDGIEASQKWAALNPDLVILDIKMPRMSGLEVCRLLREQPDHLHTRILAISGDFSWDLPIKAFHRGASEFLQKPFELKDLTGSIKRLL